MLETTNIVAGTTVELAEDMPEQGRSNPLSFISGAWIVGVCLGAFVPIRETTTCVCAILCLSAGTFVAMRHVHLYPGLTSLGLGIAALFVGLSTRTTTPSKRTCAANASSAFQLQVESIDFYETQPVSRLRILDGPLRDCVVAAKGAFDIDAVLSVTGRVRPRTDFRNLSPHPSWPWQRSSDGFLRIDEARLVSAPRFSIERALERGRTTVRSAIMHSLPSKSASLVRAMILGESHALDKDDSSAVRNAGLTHVIAVSGFHITVLVGILVIAITKFFQLIPRLAETVDVRRYAWLIGAGLAPIYAAFSGGADSAYRAAIMSSLTWMIRASNRLEHLGTVLASSALIYGFIRPTQIVHPGFLLSFAATAAVLPLTFGDNRLEQNPIFALFQSTLRATSATAPIILWCFNTLPMIGLFANIALVPLSAVALLPLAATHACIATFVPFVAPMIAPLTNLISTAFMRACGAFGRITWGQTIPPLTVTQGIAISVAIWVLFVVKSWRIRALTLAAACAVCALSEWRLRTVEKPHNKLRVTFLDVGQGDSTLIDFPDGRAMLIDGGGAWASARGGNTRTDPGANAIVPLLRARRRNALDVVVLTHPHPDHYGGLYAVLRDIKVGELWDNGEASTGASAVEVQRLIQFAKAHGTRVRQPNTLCNSPNHFGSTRVRVLAPCPNAEARFEANDNSLVIEFREGSKSFLFTGDIEQKGEQRLVERHTRLNADILKLAHHGSKTSSTDVFLNMVSPTIAVVSAGIANRFGHPHKQVLDRLEARGTQILRTDLEGSIEMTMEKNVFSMRTFEHDTPQKRHD